jgi:hypothetical protein
MSTYQYQGRTDRDATRWLDAGEPFYADEEALGKAVAHVKAVNEENGWTRVRLIEVEPRTVTTYVQVGEPVA